MATTFFYLSIIAMLILFIICYKFRKPTLASIVIGLTTVGYSLISDIILGDQLKLFYYISPQQSTFYMVLSALLIYSILNILYTMFLPQKGKHALVYTFCWIVVLLLFEYTTIVTKTIVFTGWAPFPWSLVTYIVAYAWIYCLHRYLAKKMPA
ncbi:MAG: hypothetical protein H7Y41_03845 [Hyphomonadaceae bacterium]|nr:hypothetical protein [Clostridia bacterium]